MSLFETPEPAPARQGAESRKLHLAVFLSAGLTLLAAVSIADLRRTETGAALESILLVRPPPESHKEIAADFIARARGLDDAALAQLARSVVAANDPELLNRMGLHLVSDRENKEAGRAGVFLFDAGAELYRSPLLLERAGWQHYLGRFVDRDFKRALMFLNDPRLRYRPRATYWRGRVLHDARNPDGDEKEGLALIRAAAARGEEAAIRWLDQSGLAGEDLGDD